MPVVHVHGAGIIGLTVAHELRRRGHRVTVVDRSPASGASRVAAGMLAPGAETWHGEEQILRLGLASLGLWPALAEDLGVPLLRTGTLLVGHDTGDLEQVRRQSDLLARHGRPVEVLRRAALADLEPGLGRLAGGALLPEEASVDPRAVCAALLDRVDVVPAGGRLAPPDHTVIATGSVLPAPYRRLVRGVRGEILRLRMRPDDLPGRTVRGWVAGQPIYLVPRADGGLVAGATTEEHDAPPAVSAGGVLRLLAAARALWPATDRAELVEAAAGDRPATADGLPLVGPVDPVGPVGPVDPEHPRTLLAAGHYRHGVLLAPLTARIVADHLDGHPDGQRPTDDPGLAAMVAPSRLPAPTQEGARR